MNTCYPLCDETRTINRNECDNLCSSYCKDSIEQATNLSSLQVKCLLLCARLSYEKPLCNSICNIKTKQNVRPVEKNADLIEDRKDDENKENLGQGCVGYGSEVCYKLCRLIERQPVETC